MSVFRKLALLMTVVSSGLLLVRTAAADQFVLEIPGDPTTRSSATVSAREIIVIDAAGGRFQYLRRPEQDSPDGRYLAFFSERANRFLRWPAGGEGAMYLGTIQLGTIQWQRSQMQVRPVARAVGGVVAGGLVGVGGAVPVEPMHVAALPGADGNVAAHVDRDGQLHFFVERDGRWQHRETDLRSRLPAGAPLVLVDEPRDELPTVYGVDARGRLIEVRAGQLLREVALREALRFAPHSALAVLRRGNQSRLVGVDDRGRLFDLDPTSGEVEFIEARTGLLEPGVALVALTGDVEDHVFLTDRRGHLLGYAWQMRIWSRPFRIASDLVASGGVSGVYASPGPGRAARMTLSAVDARGRLHLYHEAVGGWDDEVIDAGRFVPGGATAMVTRRAGLSLTTVAPDGRWVELRDDGGLWTSHLVATGFHAGGHSVLLANGPAAFAVDRTGRLVSARYFRDAWEGSLCLPGKAFAPRLVRRSIEPNPPLPPANVEFENRHTEELVVRIQNTSAPDVPLELTIPPRKSVAQRIERNSGATLEEIYLVPGPGGELVKEVHRHPLPARSMVNVVVYVNRVTSVYFDRTKNKSSVPDEANTSLVSLGVFSLPAGELLRDNERVDVYRQAISRRNSGAAALVDPQRP